MDALPRCMTQGSDVRATIGCKQEFGGSETMSARVCARGDDTSIVYM
jgi:hypothetical protein